jgi:transcriptional regulator with XRE-family HTH domain
MLSHSETQHNHKRKQGRNTITESGRITVKADRGDSLMGDHVNSKSTLWASVLALMNQHYGGENLQRFAKDADIGIATVQRIKEQQTSIGLNVLDKISARFNTSAWQLLVPGFDPNNKPALRPVSDRERELYDRIMLAAKTYAGEPDPPPY